MIPDAGPVRFFCAAIAILACGACAGRQSTRSARPPYVQTVLATDGVVQPAQRLAGIVAPYQNVAIQSTLAEPADAVYVREGDTVRAGQLLAQLDTADLEAQMQSDLATANSNAANTTHTVYQGSLSISQGLDTVRTDEAAVRQAQQTLSNDQRNLARDQSLLTQGYISQQVTDAQMTQVRNDQQALNSAQANLASARSTVAANGSLSGGGMQAAAVAQSRAQEQVAIAQAQQVRVQIGKASLTSPIDGVVVNRNLNPGEYPGNRTLFVLQQVNPIYAVLHASSQQVSGISSGATAVVTVPDATAVRRYTGRVAGVLNEINPGSTDFQVKVQLANPLQRLRPGMVVQANIATIPVRGVRVPATAFTDDNHDALMTVQPDDSIKTIKVAELGSDGTTSVVSGLPSGTRIVTNGQTSVGDGEKVSFQP
jgi:HlyD family secretion protein